MPSSSFHIFQLVYISSTHDDLSKEQLMTLLELSRLNNQALSISGMLLYRDRSVIQILEGDETTVQLLFEHIRQDPRHNGVRILYQGRCAKREFPDWTMGFRDLDRQEIRDLPGYVEFLNLPLTKIDGSQCRRLLSVFKSVDGWLPAFSLPQ